MDPVTGERTVDPLKLNDAGFKADVMTIHSLVQEVVSNVPDPVDVSDISELGIDLTP